MKLLLTILIIYENGAVKFTQGMVVNSNIIGIGRDHLNTKLRNKEEKIKYW